MLESAFFGREVLNVVGAEGAERVERHDRLTTWAERFREAGFLPVVPDPPGDTFPSPFSVERVGAALALCWQGEPVLGVGAWS